MYVVCNLMNWLYVFIFQEKLIESIKKIKHEIDECYEAEKDAFVEALEVEVQYERP